MSAQYKISYFSICALAEPIRWLLSYGNLEFEDYRFQMEDWPTLKGTTPFGQVPLLEIDGKTYWQSSAICRHLARDLNLVGKTPLDALQADIIVDTITDFQQKLESYHWDPNPVTKEPKKEPLQKVTVPFYLSRFEQILKVNSGYFVNNQLTWADIFFVAFSNHMQWMSGGLDFFTDQYPNLSALKKKVMDIPEINAWIARRPTNALYRSPPKSS